MVRTLNRLSDRGIKSRGLAAGLHHDGGGRYLQVTPNGAKSWFYRYKRNGKARDMGLGSLERVSLAEAREKAEGARKLHAAGRDPLEERDRQREDFAAQREA